MIDRLKDENEKHTEKIEDLNNQLEETQNNLEIIQAAYDDLSF